MTKQTFYKGVLEEQVVGNELIVGSVTTDFKEALMLKERIESTKKNGHTRHLKRGKAVVISFEFDASNFKDHNEFQRSGINEHSRDNCWMNINKTKAQINEAVKVSILTANQIDKLYTQSLRQPV